MNGLKVHLQLHRGYMKWMFFTTLISTFIPSVGIDRFGSLLESPERHTNAFSALSFSWGMLTVKKI